MSLTYLQAHRQLGPAQAYTCPCGELARDWAYQYTATNELLEDGRPYSEEAVDYIPMCRSCHQTLDYSKGVERGWATVWANPSAEFLENHARGARENGVVARTRLAVLQADPTEGARIRARQSEGGKVGGCSRVRRCLSCGREMNAAVMGRHQKTSGHTGLEEVA